MKKNRFLITHTTEFGTGIQLVKANTSEEARTKFKKRFPKKSIISCTKSKIGEAKSLRELAIEKAAI